MKRLTKKKIQRAVWEKGTKGWSVEGDKKYRENQSNTILRGKV